MWSRISSVRNISRTKEGVISFSGFPHGLNTSVPSLRIAKTEASSLINYVLKRGGKLVTRNPVVVYSADATTSNAAIKTIAQANIGGTNYKLAVDANYVLYYLDETYKHKTIGTLEGGAKILSYNGVAIILDGSYIKYLDGVSSVKIAYDAGTGSSGYQFDNTALSNDGSFQLGDGTNSRIHFLKFGYCINHSSTCKLIYIGSLHEKFAILLLVTFNISPWVSCRFVMYY